MKMTEEFIERFHSLQGTLLKERKKSLFLLLESNKSLYTEDHILQEINEKLKPKTYLEETYKLELLLYFRRSSDLFELLKNGNDITASKIIRQSWFVQSLLKDFRTEGFVQCVFPELSIVMRSKILKQVLKESKNEEYINALFDELVGKYGLKPANILLSGCSCNKIVEILSNMGLKLTKSQLKLLHDKDPSLIKFYYGEYHKKEGNMQDLRSFSKYLAKKDPNLYVKLLLRYKFDSCKLGRQTTRKYVSENIEAILEQPQVYLDLEIFQERALVKQLGLDFPSFLKAVFPKKLPELMNSYAFDLLKYYQKQGRYDLYRKVFEDVYQRSLFRNEKFITDDLLEVIQNDEEREKWVRKFENRVEYVKYKRSSVAVAELVEQLERCGDIKFREQLFEYIVTSCSIGQDYDALLDTLKLFCNRFRNTDGSVLYTFLSEIHKKIKLDALTDDHWNYIVEIILIQNTRDLPINGFIVFEYSKFLYKSGKDFEKMIPIYLKADNFSLKNCEFRNGKFRDDRFQKQFLELILKHCSGEKESLHISTDIVLAIRDWNKRHPDNVIIVSEKREIIEAIRKSVDVDWLHYESKECLCMKYLVCRENIHEDFTDIYVNHMDFLENVTMTKWYLKYIPGVFEQKIDKVSKWFDLKTRYSLMKTLKKYEHTGLVETITKHYLKKLKDPKEGKKDRIAQLLASIMPKNEYLELLDQHVPKIDRLNLITASVEEINLQNVQIALAKSVRFTTFRNDALPILLNYCRGDFFQPSLFSLYSCFNRIPEKSLKKLLDHLLHKPVSVKKHAIFLSALVFPMKTNEELMRKMYDSERNDSIRNHLFTTSYKYFLKNPQEQFWNILQTHMGNLTHHQSESLKLITDIQDIPEIYKCVFMKEVSKVFSGIEMRDNVSMNVYYNKMMENVKDDDMSLLSSEVCLDIIRKKLFKEDAKRNDACVDFTIKFLMFCTNMRENIDNFFEILEVYKRNYWTGYYGAIAKSVIYTICKDIFDKTMNKKTLRVSLPEVFPLLLSEGWKKVFSIHETLQEYLMLDFMLLKYQDNDDVTSYAGEIIKIFEHLRQSYGDSISVLYKNFLEVVLKSLLGDDNYDLQLMKLLAEILRIDCSLPNCLLVVQLLPFYQFDDEFISNYYDVLEKLKAGDQIVRVFLNTYLKQALYD